VACSHPLRYQGSTVEKKKKKEEKKEEKKLIMEMNEKI